MKKNLFIIAVLLLVAGTLQADTVTYSNSVTMNNDQDAVISLNKFDASLGTLTAVYVRYVTSIAGANIQMDNDSVLAQNGTARVQNLVNSFSSSINLYGQISGLDLQINANQLFALEPTSGDTVGQFNVTGNSDYASWSPGTLQGIGSANVYAFAIGLYAGSGTYDVTVNSTYMTSATFNGSDGYFMGNTPSGAFSGTVTYTYSPIPEPATAPLMALVALVGFWIRRRFMA